MSTIQVVLTASPDGTLHLPLPAEWRHQAIRVKAELEPLTLAGAKTTEVDQTAPGDSMADAPHGGKAKLVTPQPGSLKGFRMAGDFDAPLEDFRKYMA